MGMQSDVWAVTTGSDADFYVEADTAAGAGSFTLANTKPEYNGVGYQVTVTSSGDDTGVTFTVTGNAMDGQTRSEDITGVNAATATSTTYFTELSSVAVDGATDGDITVGYGGNMALPKTRIKNLYYVASASAGSVVVTQNSTSRVLLNVPTPASATVTDGILVPGNGISTAFTPDDYATVVLTNVTSANFICG